MLGRPKYWLLIWTPLIEALHHARETLKMSELFPFISDFVTDKPVYNCPLLLYDCLFSLSLLSERIKSFPKLLVHIDIFWLENKQEAQRDRERRERFREQWFETAPPVIFKVQEEPEEWRSKERLGERVPCITATSSFIKFKTTFSVLHSALKNPGGSY